MGFCVCTFALLLVASRVEWRTEGSSPVWSQPAHAASSTVFTSVRALRGTSSPMPINVVYSSDNRTFPAMLVSMLSLARSLAAPQDCQIHLIVTEADLVSAEQLANCFYSELSHGSMFGFGRRV